MKLKFNCLLFCLFLVGNLAAQSRSFGTLPMAKKSNAAIVGAPITGTPEYEKALAIYNRLVAARGDYRFPVPDFKLTDDVAQVASMDYGKLEIVLEKKAYEVCASFGDNADAAIAFLLGHELTHYYEKHAWRSGFVSEFKGLDIGKKLDLEKDTMLIDDIAHETEADYLGGFLAYSAGYGLFDKGGEVIKKLYVAYDMVKEDPLTGYPSLADRQALSARTAQNLESLIQVFDMANLLTVIGNYSDAYEYYRYVLMQYQSREIYNNLGVTAILDAMQYFKESELKYRYPVELDLTSSASKGSSGAGSVRNNLLRQAILHFDAAISLDPDYAPAYLNKACAYALLDDTERARWYAEKEARAAIERSKQDSKRGQQYPKTATDVDVLLGILEARAGNTEAAKKILKAAAEKGSDVASTNLKIINGEPLGEEKTTTSSLGGSLRAKIESIDGKTIDDIANELPYDPEKDVEISPRIKFHQKAKMDPNSKVFIHHKGNKFTTFHLTGPGYSGESARGVKVGADTTTVRLAYGTPKTIETPLGQIWIYKSIILIFNRSCKVERWITYKED
ncbi:MAG: hypothetical protein H6574_09775 [Lewinellaceae bacterium]|nr:hypothetical protein [Lewinellaceae bacterium]